MTPSTDSLFIDTGSSQCTHFDERICGDVLKFRRIPEEGRLLSVLADGMGHGVKANILATMTATMALKFAAAEREIVHSAEIMMDALPVSRDRDVSYSTFTIVDIRPGGWIYLVEMGNPEFILLRRGRVHTVTGCTFASPKYKDRTMAAFHFQALPGDHLLYFSDGVSQAGLGTPHLPLGWQTSGAEAYAVEQLAQNPGLGAQELSERLLRQAIAQEPHLRPADDITVACIHFRTPHRLLLFTGPPVDPARDAEIGEMFRNFDGAKVVCGGTSAEIVARELKVPLKADFESYAGDLPPSSLIPGIDLVTEGIFTLTRAASYLEKHELQKLDPAGRLANLLRKYDVIEIVVGTKINEAYQDPNLPLDLEFRRNIVKRLESSLRDSYMKEVHVRFV